MNYKKKLHEASKQFLLVYFSDGVKRNPSDFDEEILGGLDLSFLSGVRPKWNKTPFFEALSDLIENDKIKYWKNSDGICYYQRKQLN